MPLRFQRFVTVVYRQLVTPPCNCSYSLKHQRVVTIYLACRKAEERTLPASAPRSLRSLSRPLRLSKRSRTTAASVIQPTSLVPRAPTTRCSPMSITAGNFCAHFVGRTLPSQKQHRDAIEAHVLSRAVHPAGGPNLRRSSPRGRMRSKAKPPTCRCCTARMAASTPGGPIRAATARSAPRNDALVRMPASYDGSYY